MVEKKKTWKRVGWCSKLKVPRSYEGLPQPSGWLVENNWNVICLAPCSGTRIFSEFLQVATGKTQLYTKSNISKNETEKKKKKTAKYIPSPCQQYVRMLGCSVSPSSLTRSDSIFQSSLHSLEKCLINLIAFSFPFSWQATTKPLK